MRASKTSANQLTRRALALPPRSRARLAEQLLSSLEEPTRKEIDALWAAEVEDRIDAFDSGKLSAIPGEEVFRALKSRKR